MLSIEDTVRRTSACRADKVVALLVIDRVRYSSSSATASSAIRSSS